MQGQSSAAPGAAVGRREVHRLWESSQIQMVQFRFPFSLVLPLFCGFNFKKTHSPKGGLESSPFTAYTAKTLLRSTSTMKPQERH